MDYFFTWVSIAQLTGSFGFQMNRPIQVKPADSEGRGGKRACLSLPFLLHTCKSPHLSHNAPVYNHTFPIVHPQHLYISTNYTQIICTNLNEYTCIFTCISSNALAYKDTFLITQPCTKEPCRFKPVHMHSCT